MRKPALLALALVATACASRPAATEGATTTTTGAETSSTTDPSTTDPSTTDPSTTTESESDDGTTFVPMMDGQTVPASCDPFAQDCAEGEKCVPYASTDGSIWDAVKCVPILGEGQPGQSCTYTGALEASDDCGPGSYCWNVVEVEGELVGTCTSFCGGTGDDPRCEPAEACLLSNEGSVALCSSMCDPLVQDCAADQACVWDGARHVCLYTTQELPLGEPCQYMNDCAPGLECVTADALPSCAGDSCCAAFCDLSDPTCGPGLECQAFLAEGAGPPVFDDRGMCLSPGVCVQDCQTFVLTDTIERCKGC